MDNQKISKMYKTLEEIRHQNGSEFWYARDLFSSLGYSKLDNFYSDLDRAIESCRNSGSQVSDHFTIVSRKFYMEDGKEEAGEDVRLTRYASYLVALNADPKKEEVAFAQAYFVTQTRKIEVLLQKMTEFERIDAREKLKITEKDFSSTVHSRGVEGPGIALIKSQGDKMLFGGKSTEEMKQMYGIKSKPLADFLPSVTLKAKDLAMAMTTEVTRKKDLVGVTPIMKEHEDSNRGVRGALTQSGIYPENLPPAEDIKRIQTAKNKELKALQKKQKRDSRSKKKKS